MRSEPQKNCPNCYFENPIHAKTCGFCGWQLLDENGVETLFEDTPLPGATTSIPNDQTTHQETTETAYCASSKGFHLQGELSHFRVQRIIGKGGMGTVYQAYDETLKRYVAIKVLRDHRTLDKTKKNLLLEEAQAICQLNHPNIVTLFDVARGENNNFIIMEWVDGQTLNQLTAQNGLSAETALNFAIQILEGLCIAHKNHIIHSDIKPQNIMLTEQGLIKILDFSISGLASLPPRVTSADPETLPSVLKVNGTPGYMSPEQAMGRQQLDQRSDIFAFGILFYHMLTGKHAFVGGNAREKITAIMTGDYQPLPANISVELRAIVNQCLKHSLTERYQSSQALLEDLKRVKSGDPVSVIKSQGYWLGKKTRKFKWQLSLLAVLVLGSTGLFVWQQIQSSHQAQREILLTDFSRRVESMEAEVRLARMSPPHNTTEMQQRWRTSISVLQTQIEKIGELAVGPGNDAIGRIYYNLQEYQSALTHLQHAWKSGFQTEKTAYYLALAHGALYQREYAIIQNLNSSSARRDRLDKLNDQHKLPAINYLQKGIASSPQSTYANALLAFYQGHNQQALQLLDNFTEHPPWFYEHHMLKGDILLNEANRLGSQGQQETSNLFAQRAMESYQTARVLAPSDLSLQLKPLSVFFRRITGALYGDGQQIPELIVEAKEQLAHATKLAPNSSIVHFSHGQLLGLQSDYENWFVGEPIETQQQTSAAFESARQLSPKDANILLALGLSYIKQAESLQERDIPTGNLFEKARSVLQSISASQRDYYYYNNLGNLLNAEAIDILEKDLINRMTSANYQVNASYLERFASAENAFKNARALQPQRLGAAINLGNNYLDWANNLQGKSSLTKLDQALSTFNKLLQSHPEHFVVNYYLGVAYRNLAKRQNQLFENNAQAIEQAKAYLDKAQQIQPNHPYAINELAILKIDQAEYTWLKGLDPVPEFKVAMEFLSLASQNYTDNTLLLQNSRYLKVLMQQIQHFSPHLSLNEAVMKSVSFVATPGSERTIDRLLPKLLDKKRLSISVDHIIDKGSPHDTKLLLAIYYSGKGNYKKAASLFQDIGEQQLNLALKLLYQRQNYKAWLNSTTATHTTVKIDINEKVANKIVQVEQLLQQLYPNLWQKIENKQAL